jgi:hypothetical protein
MDDEYLNISLDDIIMFKLFHKNIKQFGKGGK